jgi:hypothetical protein
MKGAQPIFMPLRSFLAKDGAHWTVWLVIPSHGVRIVGTASEWLSFQNADGTQRCRLTEVPANWRSLTDERLDLLRRMATPVSNGSVRHSPPGGFGSVDDDAALVAPLPDDE